LDSRLAYVRATSQAESFRREAEHHVPRRRHSPRRAPGIPLVLMFLRAGRG
jgi:hypothetical protein